MQAEYLKKLSWIPVLLLRFFYKNGSFLGKLDMNM